jgi:hypothetical protein
MYGTGYEQRDIHIYPTHGITECGVQVRLIPGAIGACCEGEYVNDDRMLTCIRCLSGVSTDGISFRQDWKMRNFAKNYGMSGQKFNRMIQGSAADISKVKGLTYGATYLDEAMDFATIEKKLLAAYTDAFKK